MTKPIDPAHFEDAAEPGAPGQRDRLDFVPVQLEHRHHGWSVERQRLFIRALAETGCVSEACEAAGVTPRSAYRLRLRPGAESFEQAWREALVIGSHRLTTVAFDRAIHGTPRKVWHKGEVVGEECVPSERLLIYLLKHFDRRRYGNLSGFLEYDIPDPVDEARAAYGERLAALADDPGRPVPDGLESFVMLPELD